MARTKQTARKASGGIAPGPHCSLFIYDHVALKSTNFNVDVLEDNCFWFGAVGPSPQAFIRNKFPESTHEHENIEKIDFKVLQRVNSTFPDDIFNLFRTIGKLKSLLLERIYDTVIDPDLDEKIDKKHFEETILQDGLFDTIVSYLDPLSMIKLSMSNKELYYKIMIEKITKNGSERKIRFRIPPLAIVAVKYEEFHEQFNSERETTEKENSKQENNRKSPPKKKTKLE